MGRVVAKTLFLRCAVSGIVGYGRSRLSAQVLTHKTAPGSIIRTSSSTASALSWPDGMQQALCIMVVHPQNTVMKSTCIGDFSAW